MIDQYRPVLLTPEQVQKDWPRAAVTRVENGEAVEKTGRIVGRSIAGKPLLDVMLDDDRSIIRNLPAAEVRVIQ